MRPVSIDFPEFPALDGLIERALEEDIGTGDLTSELVLEEARFGNARIVARESGVIAGMPVARAVFGKVDDTLILSTAVEEGSGVEADSEVLRIEGNGRSILAAERTALNFLGHLSGVATLTRRFVEAVDGTDATIIDTRKTTPTMRALEKYAVRVGGGANHRMGLYDMVLIKENHARWAGGMEKALQNALRVVGKGRDVINVTVEVRDIRELDTVLRRGVDRVMLDNMTVEDVRAARKQIPSSFEVEVSGGLTLDNVRDYAETGVDYVSIGALTHSAPSLSLSLLFD